MEPRFLQGSLGPLFTIYHPPKSSVLRRGSILYIHPFAEESNKSRRMVALQARRFAALGFGVLLPDLYGCNDSGGDFSEARWDVWLADLQLCMDWLRWRGGDNLNLWGLRLGALLAMELVRETAVARVILWQPVINGAQMLTQFLRLRMAAGMMDGVKETTGQLREVLAAGHSVEVAGYEVSPVLAAALDRACLEPPSADSGIRVDWFELATEAGRPLSPVSRRLVEDWQAAGVDVDARTVPGEPFWSTQEITVAPALLEATTASLSGTLS